MIFSKDDSRILFATNDGLFQANVEGDRTLTKVMPHPLKVDRMFDIGNNRLVCTNEDSFCVLTMIHSLR